MQQLQNAIAEAAEGAFVRYEVRAAGIRDKTMIVDFSIKPVYDSDGNVPALSPKAGISPNVNIQKRRCGRQRNGSVKCSRMGHWAWRYLAAICDLCWQTSCSAICWVTRPRNSNKNLCRYNPPGHVNTDLADQEAYPGTIPRYRTDKRYIRKDGSEMWGALTVGPLRTKREISFRHSPLLKISLSRNAPLPDKEPRFQENPAKNRI